MAGGNKEMERDLNKLQEEYKRLIRKRKGMLYPSDIKQIMENSGPCLSEKIIYGVEIGIAIGYRIGKRERKERG